MELPVKIEGLYEAGRRAYYGISFSPEKRAEQIVKECEEQLNEDLAGMPDHARERYVEGYKKHLFAWLGAMSRIVSPMISGPSNFPVRRMQKANQSEHNRSTEFTEWRRRALNAIEKYRLRSRSQEEVLDDKWKSVEKSITSSAAMIIAIDNGTQRGYNRALFVNSITGLVDRIAKNGDLVTVKRALKLIREINEKHGTIITDRNNIWKLEEVAEAAAETQRDRERQENREVEFEGGKVIFNYEIDRIQIAYDSKPDEETRAALRKNAFKWSPSNVVWQRQLTRNAIWATEKLLGIELK